MFILSRGCDAADVASSAHNICIIFCPAPFMRQPPIALIVAALLPDLGIGYGGALPWRLKQEIKYFRDVTSNAPDGSINAVIMGRRTWESIPPRFRPLPNRINVVLSRSNPNLEENDVFWGNSFDTALEFLQKRHDINKIFVIGGAEIYNQVINDPRISHLLLTEVSANNDATIPMDRFLHFPREAWTRSPHLQLLQFTGIDATDSTIKEGDFSYNYSLWCKK